MLRAVWPLLIFLALTTLVGGLLLFGHAGLALKISNYLFYYLVLVSVYQFWHART